MKKVELGTLEIGDDFKYDDDTDGIVFTIEEIGSDRVYMEDGEIWELKHTKVFIEDEIPYLRYNENKPPVQLVESGFIIGVAKVLKVGAEKYEQDNWKKIRKKDIKDITGSMFRHLLAYNDGEKLDTETGLSHLYHVGANAMFLDYAERKEEE